MCIYVDMSTRKKFAIQAYCGDPTRAMLCSSGARKSWQSKLSAGIRREPRCVAVALEEVATPSSL